MFWNRNIWVVMVLYMEKESLFEDLVPFLLLSIALRHYRETKWFGHENCIGKENNEQKRPGEIRIR